MATFIKSQARTVLETITDSNAVVGVVADRDRLAIALSTGEVWSATLKGRSTSTLAGVIAAVNRPVWTVEPMHRTTRTLIDLGVEDVAYKLRNVTTAEAIIVPEPAHRRAVERGFGADRKDAEGAACVAASVAAWIAKQEVGVRRLALQAVELDMVWRHRVIAGWSVDFDAFEVAAEAAADERVRIYVESRLPLADALTDRAEAAALTWLAEVGLHPTHLGSPSMVKDAIEELREPEQGTEARRRWELATAAMRYKKAQPTLAGIDRGYAHGRVHAEVKLFSARTGRTSVSQAPLQGIGSANRHLLRASAGNVLVAVDLAQAEVRIAAALSGDTALMAALEGGDAYAAMARTIWGVVDVTPELRARAKTIMISVLYGKGVKSTAASLGVTVDEARKLIDQFWGAYPALAAFNERAKAAAGTQVYTRTMGRPLPITPEAYKMLNLLVQAEGADIITTRAAAVAARLGTESMWLSVHDELVVEVTPDRVEEAVQVLAEEITVPFLGVPMRGSPEVLGRAWRK